MYIRVYPKYQIEDSVEISPMLRTTCQCSEGRLVHIDFGFILETSPGGNMRFESAHFKLSHEMTQLLDPSGVMKSETWNQFVR